jgi:hypothetical protein
MPTPDPQHPLLESWLAQLQKQGCSPHPRQAYRRGWGHLAQWYGQTYGETCDPNDRWETLIFIRMRANEQALAGRLRGYSSLVPEWA